MKVAKMIIKTVYKQASNEPWKSHECWIKHEGWKNHVGWINH